MTSFRTLPIWVKFPELDLQFWTPRLLSRIASIIGEPKGVDKLTKDRVRLSYARLLIEVNAGKPLKDFIMLKGPNGELKKQLVDSEFRPFHCSRCSSFGHTPNRCALNVNTKSRI